MKVIVTGGAGFIGANFLNLVVPRHPEHAFVNVDKLTYAANLASLRGTDERANYELERVDIADAAAVEDLVSRHEPDLVVHFAAESHVDRSILGPREFVRTNVDGTFNLLEACRTLADKDRVLFHHVSTDEVFGSLEGTGAFDELSRYDPSSPYSATKAASDHLVRAYARTFGLRTRITNCSNNYGPFQFPEKLVPLMILNAVEGKPLPVYGRGENVRDWLHVEDHCEAIWATIERGRVGETYNIGADCQRRNIDVVETICELVADETGRPAAELKALIRFVEDRPGHDLRYAIDAAKVRAECGWTPRHTFESGLRQTVRWYLANGAWVEKVRTGEYRRYMEANYGGR